MVRKNGQTPKGKAKAKAKTAAKLRAEPGAGAGSKKPTTAELQRKFRELEGQFDGTIGRDDGDDDDAEAEDQDDSGA